MSIETDRDRIIQQTIETQRRATAAWVSILAFGQNGTFAPDAISKEISDTMLNPVVYQNRLWACTIQSTKGLPNSWNDLDNQAGSIINTLMPDKVDPNRTDMDNLRQIAEQGNLPFSSYRSITKYLIDSADLFGDSLINSHVPDDLLGLMNSKAARANDSAREEGRRLASAGIAAATNAQTRTKNRPDCLSDATTKQLFTSSFNYLEYGEKNYIKTSSVSISSLY